MAQWQELVVDKQKRQREAIPHEWLINSPSADQLDVMNVPASCGLLSPIELAITETDDVCMLLDKLSKGQWSSVDVTRAYYKRAIIAHQLTNCLTEIYVERALVRAAECDEYLKRTGKPIGPLHGLPVSLKDQIRVKGLETTMGYVSWIGTYATHDAAIVSILLEAGAVPFVRTNLPQTLMWPETFNNVFGRTLNPHNRNLTSGGSSGGEGALIALKGSPLGVGSDIGGSIRIPSAFNGVYGLRPSYNRLPYEGCANSIEGQDSIPSVLGPISVSLSGLKVLTKAVINSEPWRKDPLAIRKPWDEEAYQLKAHGQGRNLCFAILWNDGFVIPHPPIRRALDLTKSALESQGIKVIDWPEFNYLELGSNLALILGAGATEDFRTICDKTSEPIIATMEPEGGSTESTSLLPDESLSAFQLWQLQKKKTELRKAHLDLWESTAALTGTGRPVDAIIAPVAPYAAPPHGKNRNCNYTLIWNGLDSPSCTFPVSKVDLLLDAKPAPHKFLNEYDEANYNLYEPELFKNAPIALQLVGQTLEEEAVIRMTEIADAIVKQYAQKRAKL